MKITLRIFASLLLVTLSVTSMAQGSAEKNDSRALDVLMKMSNYKATFDDVVIHATSSGDLRLGEGLLVATTAEVTVHMSRPGSLHFLRFDGKGTKELNIHNGDLTIYDDATGFYAKAKTPPGIDAAMDVALDDFKIDLPLGDILQKDTYNNLVSASDEILYITDKSRVRGVDCHHIALRMAEIDVQLWIEEGDKPLPRRIMITSKWDGGAPRFTANLDWNTAPKISDKRYDFTPPKGSSQIDFINAPTN
jgi:hypothetical protein